MGPYEWGPYPYIVRDREKWKESTQAEKKWDPQLRSTNAVSGYHIQASDGEIGNVEDFIIDDEAWAIRYLIINTQNWWPGKKVVISPKWIERVSWNESKVFVNLTREAIKQSPEYTEESLLTRDYEVKLHQYYHREGYWVSSEDREKKDVAKVDYQTQLANIKKLLDDREKITNEQERARATTIIVDNLRKLADSLGKPVEKPKF
jgi:sporulation protein YlmC with PRC-barrel domain